ncbi:hypothetical protein AB0N14_00500 [Streptomyces sp. NPDC051104]|uniref:hypothetical protein n=1 Tax=Streptomyces sp. NPDC051104 TaxID=3155044 RepID=UPI00344486B3
MLMAIFGILWWLSGSMAMDIAARGAAAVAGVALGAILCWLAARQISGHRSHDVYARAANRFRMTNVIQAGAIVAVIVIGNATGERGWIPGLIAVVVGLHFLPLAGPFERPEYRWVGGFMALLGVSGCGLAFAGAPAARVLSVVGMGCAVVLWASVVWLLSAARSQRRDQLG